MSELIERLSNGPQAGCADQPGWEDLCAEAAAEIERLTAEVAGLRDVLLGIALTDRYRRYPKQYEDGGLRGQSGLRAVRALTGQHGSHLNDDEVGRLDKEARARLSAAEGE